MIELEVEAVQLLKSSMFHDSYFLPMFDDINMCTVVPHRSLSMYGINYKAYGNLVA